MAFPNRVAERALRGSRRLLSFGRDWRNSERRPFADSDSGRECIGHCADVLTYCRFGLFQNKCLYELANVRFELLRLSVYKLQNFSAVNTRTRHFFIGLRVPRDLANTFSGIGSCGSAILRAHGPLTESDLPLRKNKMFVRCTTNDAIHTIVPPFLHLKGVFTEYLSKCKI